MTMTRWRSLTSCARFSPRRSTGTRTLIGLSYRMHCTVVGAASMSQRGIEALRAEHDEVLRLVRTLTEAEWDAPSDCAGWRVQDVVAHLANTFRMAVDPGS